MSSRLQECLDAIDNNEVKAKIMSLSGLSVYVRGFLITIFCEPDILQHKQLSHILNASIQGSPVDIMVHITRNCMRLGLVDEIGVALEDYQADEPQVVQDILRKMDMKDRNALSDYVTLGR